MSTGLERCRHGATIFTLSKVQARTALQPAHDTLKAYDPGGLERSDSPGDHTRLAHPNPSTTGPDGRFKR